MIDFKNSFQAENYCKKINRTIFSPNTVEELYMLGELVWRMKYETGDEGSQKLHNIPLGIHILQYI